MPPLHWLAVWSQWVNPCLWVYILIYKLGIPVLSWLSELVWKCLPAWHMRQVSWWEQSWQSIIEAGFEGRVNLSLAWAKVSKPESLWVWFRLSDYEGCKLSSIAIKGRVGSLTAQPTWPVAICRAFIPSLVICQGPLSIIFHPFWAIAAAGLTGWTVKWWLLSRRFSRCHIALAASVVFSHQGDQPCPGVFLMWSP